MSLIFKSKILNITFILFTIFSFDFQKVSSKEKFDELNIEYLNQERSTKYIIGPGDTLEINSMQFDLENADRQNQIYKNDNELKLNNFYVNGDGTINMPRLNNIFVEGLTVDELSFLLNKKYKEFFVDPDITIKVTKFRNISIYVDGEVNNPGIYRLPGTIETTIPLIRDEEDQNIILKKSLTTSSGVFPRLYDALSSAGGITSYSDLSNISIVRKNHISNGGGKIGTTINFLKVIETGSNENNIRIFDGDIIKVTKSDIDLTEQLSKAVKSNLNPRFVNVIVAGRIESPGSIRINKSSSLNEAILMKGGVKPLSGRVNFLRYSDEGLIDKRSFRYRKSSPKGSFKNPILRNGDVIIIGQSGFNVTSSVIQEITSPFIGIKALRDILD